MPWGILFAEGSEQHIMKDKHQPVYILSRSAAEKMLQDGFPRNTFVISFYDPPSKRTGQVSKPLDYGGKPLDVFYVPLYDIDPEILEEYGLSYDTYFPEAPELAAAIYYAMDTLGVDIVCQCEYGQSRSAACAAAIREHFYGEGIEIFADYRYYPNQLVYNKLKAALDAEGLQRNPWLLNTELNDIGNKRNTDSRRNTK